MENRGSIADVLSPTKDWREILKGAQPRYAYTLGDFLADVSSGTSTEAMRYVDNKLSFQDGKIVVSERDPGALEALKALEKDTEAIDPDSMLGAESALVSFDRLGIYGHDISVLYKDICNEDAVKTHAVLRAAWHKIISASDVKSAIAGESRLDVGHLLGEVQKQLPNFAKKYQGSSTLVTSQKADVSRRNFTS